MIIEFLQPIITLYLSDPIAQTAGLLGMIFVIMAYLHQDDTKTIKTLFVANFFWALLFFFMDAYAGLAAVFLSSLRLILSLYFKKNIIVFFCLAGLIGILSYLTYQGPTSILPIVTSFIGAYGFMFLSGLHLRISCLIASLLWLTYHMSLGVIGGIVNETIVQVLLVIAILRFKGVNMHRFHVVDTIKHLIHFPYREIDYGDYVIMKDKTKISAPHKMRQKILVLFETIKKTLSNKIQKTKNVTSKTVSTVQEKTIEVKEKLPKIKKIRS